MTKSGTDHHSRTAARSGGRPDSDRRGGRRRHRSPGRSIAGVAAGAVAR
jgi:hypothetical protein